MRIFRYLLGFLLIILGVVLTRWFLEFFISPYAIIKLYYKLPMELVSVLFIILGVIVLIGRFDNISFVKVLNLYKFIGITFFSAVILFIFINIAFYVIFIVKDTAYYRDQIFLGYKERLEPLYSTMSKHQISKLLYETWARPYSYEPFVQFKESPYTGKYVNVHKAGFRLSKDQGPWPPDQKNINVFLFGGSTTFNYGVKDDQTIASHLQDFLSGSKKTKKKVFVYNFGRGHYFSTQERLLFENLLMQGFIPTIAVFIDGLNDFYYPDNEPLFSDELRKFIEGKGTNLLSLPLVSVIKNVKRFSESDTKKNSDFNSSDNNFNLIKKVIKRYEENKKVIELIGNIHGVKTVFVWQPVPTYKYDLKHHIFSGKGFGRFILSRYGYEYMEKYKKNNILSSNFLWLANMQEGVKKSLYVDIDHYSEEMSREIAKEISKFLLKSKLIV